MTTIVLQFRSWAEFNAFVKEGAKGGYYVAQGFLSHAGLELDMTFDQIKAIAPNHSYIVQAPDDDTISLTLKKSGW